MRRRRPKPYPREYIEVRDPLDCILPGKIIRVLIEQGGHLVITKLSRTGEILTALEFGEESPGSPMVGGAAYGRALTVEDALGEVAHDLR